MKLTEKAKDWLLSLTLTIGANTMQPNPININQLLDNLDPQAFNRFAQVIPEQMMQEIQASANAKNISVDVEIITRFLVTFTKAEALGVNTQSEKIMKLLGGDSDEDEAANSAAAASAAAAPAHAPGDDSALASG
jgi:hypothetical protein